mmetsp:Transcript_71406/g.225503  ORF Transcript_71406/g.225503 Transcript_71406/m.225503 type:complete len:212 (-) Transcript_71406:1556-2191(-)
MLHRRDELDDGSPLRHAGPRLGYVVRLEGVRRARLREEEDGVVVPARDDLVHLLLLLPPRDPLAPPLLARKGVHRHALDETLLAHHQDDVPVLSHLFDVDGPGLAPHDLRSPRAAVLTPQHHGLLLHHPQHAPLVRQQPLEVGDLRPQLLGLALQLARLEGGQAAEGHGEHPLSLDLRESEVPLQHLHGGGPVLGGADGSHDAVHLPDGQQ